MKNILTPSNWWWKQLGEKEKAAVLAEISMKMTEAFYAGRDAEHHAWCCAYDLLKSEA